MRRLLFLLPFLAMSACKPALLPNSSVADTHQNQMVMSFINNYKAAADARSVDGIMSLVAEDYFEEGGASGVASNYGYSQLKEKLTNVFSKVESVNLRLHVQKIERNANMFDVFYYFVERALVNYPSEKRWINVSDVNRIVLRMKGSKLEEGFEIVSGL